ncbi:MAG: hypothetical protein ACXABD_16315 [Candidatus Thorarchaeota archaeon]|jgi:hypothetical protein
MSTKKTLEVDDILVSCWGYGQTNVDFFQVVRTTSKSAWLVPISHYGVDEKGKSKKYTYIDGSGYCLPKKLDNIKEDSVSTRKLILYSSEGEPYTKHIEYEYANAYLWNGKPVRESWYY